MSLKNTLIASATLGLAATTGPLGSHSALAADAKATGEEKCYGTNTCKGTAKCGVSKTDIEATKAAFGDKFAKSAMHDCAGQNGCGASTGQLNWTSVPKGTCIKEKKGFLIEDKGGKKSVKKA